MCNLVSDNHIDTVNLPYNLTNTSIHDQPQTLILGGITNRIVLNYIK